MNNRQEYHPYQEYSNQETWTVGVPCFFYIPCACVYYYPASIPAYPASRIARGEWQPALPLACNVWQPAPLLTQDDGETESEYEYEVSALAQVEQEDHCCINSVLPDELIVKVLANLSIVNIVKSASVCKKWNQVVSSGELVQTLFEDSSVKPWYFMFSSSDESIGHVYDPAISRWYGFRIPYIEASNWQVSSSSGLVCFRPTDGREEVHVCNPITSKCRRLLDPPVRGVAHYQSLAISTDGESSKSYTVALVTFKEHSVEYDGSWDIVIDVYNSGEPNWQPPLELLSVNFRGEFDSVICGGILYLVVYFTIRVENFERGEGILAYDLASGSVGSSNLRDGLINLPCSLTCIRLMNMKGKLVMVGGIERARRLRSMKGIGIWVLKDRAWIEVARAPSRYLYQFPELDEIFVCSGSADLIYIQSYGYEDLLIYDMKLNEWSWARRRMTKKNKGLLNRKSLAIDLYSGFCFEPRFDVAP